MKFSILIPAYKAKYLKECIDSILSQTYPKFELIIVNDASPEDLDSIVNSYSDHRIHYFKNEKNCGAVNVVDNWNKCLSYASGDYVICMGDDDRLCPNCLEEYVKLIYKYPNLDIYHAWTEIIDEQSKFKSLTAPRPEYESAYSLIWNRWYIRHQQYIGDFLFKTETLRANNGFHKLPLAWGADNISAVNAAKHKGIANTQVITFQYRDNAMSISSSNFIEIKLQSIQIEKKWYEQFFIDYPPQNETEYKYFRLLKQDINQHFNKTNILTISKDVAQCPLTKIFFWISKRKYYSLSWSSIIKIFLYALNRKTKYI